jgi:signal transduction histidine kinase/ActR/RegA family two-component response regulator
VISTDAAATESRVLGLTPTRTDARTTERLLTEAGIRFEICSSFDGLIEQLRLGAAAILVPEEAFSSARNTAMLSGILATQPPWSDLPVLVLTKPGADSAESGAAARTLGNVTLLERPVRQTTLVSAVRTALRARDRQHEIRDHLAERARAEATLRLADQRKDEFLATLGHELRNPLAPLLTGLQLLKVSGPHDERVQRISAVMERQINHLVRLVDDLLEVSRITRGVIEVRRDSLDLTSIVRSAIDTSRPAIEAARHELTVDMPADGITIEGDRVRLTQVFANLLTNAAKYTDPGGHIWLSVRREATHVVLSVRDNGIGIPSSQLASVFDMFTQVDRFDRRTQGGLGIGLTLVRSLVAMHGGQVEARSAGMGAGSEFVVELPLAAGGPSNEETSDAFPRLPPRRVLIVDDNRDAAETLGALLTEMGATVSTADCGPAALESLTHFLPDAVILDIGMPGMDGYEVARRIRSHPQCGAVLLIALTGWGQEHDVRRSDEAGFDHHIVKPADMGKLRALLMPRGSEEPGY